MRGSRGRNVIGLLLVLGTLGAVAAPAHAADRIYWATTDGAIGSADPSGAGSATALYTGQGWPAGIDVDVARNRLIWGDYDDKAIRYAPTDGSGPVSDLTSISDSVRGVAVDPAGDRLLWEWAEGLKQTPLAGGDSTSFLDCCKSGATGPEDGWALAVDDLNRRVYFNSGVGGSGLYSASLDGSGPRTELARYVSDDEIGGVAVDPLRGFVYWTNSNSGGGFSPGSWEIRRRAIDGSGPVDVLYKLDGNLGGIAVDAAEGYLYWAAFADDAIRRAPLDGSGPVRTVVTTPGPPRPITLLRTPLNTSAPELSGEQGTLGCGKGTWTSEDVHGSFVHRPPITRFSYRWQRNGADIAGANQASFTPHESGEYGCVVSAYNSAGRREAASATRTVTVALPPPAQTLSLGRTFVGRSGSIFVPIACTNGATGVCGAKLKIVFKKPRHGFKTIERRLRLRAGTSVTRIALSRKQRRKVLRIRRLRVTVGLTTPAGDRVSRADTLYGAVRLP